VCQQFQAILEFEPFVDQFLLFEFLGTLFYHLGLTMALGKELGFSCHEFRIAVILIHGWGILGDDELIIG